MFKKIVYVSVPLICVIVFMQSCVYDKADIVYPKPPECDTAVVRLSVELKEIMTAHCFDCHSGDASAGGGIRLDVYDDIQYFALSGILLSAITHDGVNSSSEMPKGAPKLDDCSINKFRAWINRGAPNN